MIYKELPYNKEMLSRWKNMKTRCSNTKYKSYHCYGGKGITILWESYLKFYRDMIDGFLEHANRYGLDNTTIDRIDNNGNYCKENCRWATYKVQRGNQSNRTGVNHEGLYFNSIQDLCNFYNVSVSNFYHRWKRGLSINECISKSRLKRTGVKRYPESGPYVTRRTFISRIKRGLSIEDSSKIGRSKRTSKKKQSIPKNRVTYCLKCKELSHPNDVIVKYIPSCDKCK